MNEWISVKDRLPNKFDRVLAINLNYPYYCIAELGNYGWSYEDACYDDEPTHWMQLPKPPQE